MCSQMSLISFDFDSGRVGSWLITFNRVSLQLHCPSTIALIIGLGMPTEPYGPTQSHNKACNTVPTLVHGGKRDIFTIKALNF